MSVRLLKLFIAASLLANVLLLGIAFGHMGRSLVGMECGKTTHHHINMLELVSVLSVEKQREIQPDVARFDQGEKQLMDQMMQLRRKIVEIVQAKPFDKNAYMAQIKALSDLHVRHAASIANMIAEITDKCSDEERAQLTGRLSAMLLDKPEKKAGQ